MRPTKTPWISIFFLAGGCWLFGAIAPEVPKEPLPKRGWTADDLDRKLKIIRIPELNFFEVPLPDALNSLQAMALKHDPEAKSEVIPTGVQFVLLTREQPPPTITLQLRNARLSAIMDFLVELIGYEYQVRDAAIVVFKPKPKPAKKQTFRQLDTEFFELSEDMVRRLGGR